MPRHAKACQGMAWHGIFLSVTAYIFFKLLSAISRSNCSKIFFYKTTPIPDACRWIPLEKLVCLLDFSHLYAPVSVSYSQIRFFP